MNSTTTELRSLYTQGFRYVVAGPDGPEYNLAAHTEEECEELCEARIYERGAASLERREAYGVREIAEELMREPGMTVAEINATLANVECSNRYPVVDSDLRTTGDIADADDDAYAVIDSAVMIAVADLTPAQRRAARDGELSTGQFEATK